jgi:hypothetical protein
MSVEVNYDNDSYYQYIINILIVFIYSEGELICQEQRPYHHPCKII